jgi:hypothetical protein
MNLISLGQHEAKTKSLNESLRELEVKKRQLEEHIDSLNEEVTQMKASEQMHKVQLLNINLIL